MTVIPKEKWEWFGNAGHLIVSEWCRFHLCTNVGKYLVSTVGEYWPERLSRELHAQIYDPKWHEENRNRRGDDYDHAYMKRFGFEEIGCNRKYETMVFRAGTRCTCGCGMPIISGSELDSDGYNDRKTANVGHNKMCKKWARKSR